MIMTVSPFRDL